MEEIIVSKEELIDMFENQEITDTGRGWMMGNEEIEIIALHDIDPKFLQDITNAKFYKLIPKKGK
ncbi:hypothetical protein [Arcobacter arenosus]|jgi:hypothetical protein|uniref:Uncharacterized protein n=1 Tax=Arcobacter arenosus TaxID=2576037 RepID=A0A5R8XXI4_9BACT|nr:hypothetical protein [Arcobacter arenosus]TLP35795.1 hypothetical protein FDK22_14150 [Arcobacter arenosus]